MDTLSIRKAALSDIPAIQAMAQVVFRVTYATILSPEQMEYMIDWMYGDKSLEDQIAGEGRNFFIAFKGDVPCGYVSVDFESVLDSGKPLYHLQKIYVMPEFQGTGLGRVLFNHVIKFVRGKSPEGCRVELNVNRTNKAVTFYERMGMTRDRQGDFHIGNGFYMNDYIYAIEF